MNLNMIQPKNETECLLLSITKNCEMLINQTHRKTEETLEFKMAKPRQTVHFNPALEVKEDWMIGLTSLAVYNSIFNTTKGNNNFKLYVYPDGKSISVSYENVRGEIERDSDISDNTATDSQDEITGPIIIEEYRNQVTR